MVNRMADLLQVNNVIPVRQEIRMSHKTGIRIAMMAAENLIAGLTGKRPPNLINEEVLSS